MFGIKNFTKTKQTQLEKDKERRRYFAIKNYYEKKNETIKTTPNQKTPKK